MFCKPPSKNAARRRPYYEAQDARTSILANGSPEGRIRLCRLPRPADPEPLADGAGHTFRRDRRAVQARPTPVDLTRRVQALQQDLIQAPPTPASCQSRSRRQQLIPQPQSISAGSTSQGRPERSTNRIPVSAARFSIGRRPPFGRGRGGGRSGAIASQKSSGRNGRAMSDNACPAYPCPVC